MCSSILIALLTIAISSSANGDDVPNIFGIEINPETFHTLNAEQVKTEIAAKWNLAEHIDRLAETVPTNERDWLVHFKNMVESEIDIIRKLELPLSHLNTNDLKNINNIALRYRIDNEMFGKLQTGLQRYVNMLKKLGFSQIVWEGRSFLCNPFEQFLGKESKKNPEGLRAATFEAGFGEAAANIGEAKKAIFRTMTRFSKRLEPQKRQSLSVMGGIRNLNLLAVPLNEKLVKKSVVKLVKDFEKLIRSTESVNDLTPAFEGLMQEPEWLDQIKSHLDTIDKVHLDLMRKLRWMKL